MPHAEPEMRAEDVVWFYEACRERGIELWIDGGWAVDALLGEQTRPHGDLDIAIEISAEPSLPALLEEHGFNEIHGKPWNYVMEDARRRQVDIHAFVLDEQGRGFLGPIENGDFYPAGCFSGTGTVLGVTLLTIAAEPLVSFHTGYPLRDSDRHDVSLLCERFNIPLPEDHQLD